MNHGQENGHASIFTSFQNRLYVAKCLRIDIIVEMCSDIQSSR